MLLDERLFKLRKSGIAKNPCVNIHDYAWYFIYIHTKMLACFNLTLGHKTDQIQPLGKKVYN